MTISGYLLLTSNTASGLDKLVKTNIGYGWQPYGSPGVAPAGDGFVTWFQAVVFYEKDEKGTS